MPSVSVIIPVHNGAATVASCLRAVLGQGIGRSGLDVIVVDDGSTDATADVVRSFPVRLLRHEINRGSTAARNTGFRAAQGEWIAFTDSDCVPSRQWLRTLFRAIETSPAPEAVTGAAGKIMGLPSEAPAARFASLTGHFDMERRLAHPTFPYAYMGNVMYRRAAIEAAGGFDEAMRIYETPGFHHRVMERFGGQMIFEPRALVLHRHPETWRRYWRQQRGYGSGYAAFLRRHKDRFSWDLWREALAWGTVAGHLAAACIPGKGDAGLVRRGMAVKHLAQTRLPADILVRAMTAHPEPSTSHPLRGVLRRLRRKFRHPGDVALALHMGWFLLTLPSRMDRNPLPGLLTRIERSPRPYVCDLDRVVRLRNPWLYRVFPSRNTCYMRALCVYRFLTPDPGSELRIHLGVEPGTDPADRLRGHAWVTLDAVLLEPPEPVVAGRVREIYVHPPARQSDAANSRMPGNR